jgi:hypothetical protein
MVNQADKTSFEELDRKLVEASSSESANSDQFLDTWLQLRSQTMDEVYLDI